MHKWKVLHSSYLLKSLYVNVRQDTCQLGNGRIIEDLVVNEYREWVNVVAITRDHHMIFVRQYRHGYGDFILEVPGGTVDGAREAPVDAIARELQEETGYASDEPPVSLGSYPTNPAMANNRISTFLIRNVYRKTEQQLDDTEEIEVVLIPFDQVNDMVRHGEISQMFTVAAYYVAEDYLARSRPVDGN